MIKWWRNRKKQKQCFHHLYDPIFNGHVSYIKSRLINTGKGKMFWCTECNKTWFA